MKSGACGRGSRMASKRSPYLGCLEREKAPLATSHDLVAQQPHLLISIDAFLTERECEKLIDACSADLQGPSAADLTPRKNEAFLNRESTSFVDAAFAGIRQGFACPAIFLTRFYRREVFRMYVAGV